MELKKIGIIKMMNDKIIIKGARVNNLKNIDIELPRNKLIIMTGLSGSGKTSLAFDTIYAEGQRRYVESLSSYARQFLGGIEKPDVDEISGLSPAISIDQKTTSNNPRSTVGTVTEIYDYLRLLYARCGTPYCPTHHKPIEAQTVSQILEMVGALPEEVVALRRAAAHKIQLQKQIRIPKSTQAQSKEEREKTIVAMYNNGHSLDDIWQISGFKSKSSVFRILNKYGVELNRGKFRGPLGKRQKHEE